MIPAAEVIKDAPMLQAETALKSEFLWRRRGSKCPSQQQMFAPQKNVHKGEWVETGF